MDLVEQAERQRKNLLPQDGVVHYFGRVMTSEEADYYFNALMQAIDWRHDQVVVYGKTITTKRQVAWYGDQPFTYTYSKITRTAQAWIPLLQALKKRVEQVSGEVFNACLLNLYHDGSEGMAWHSDAEKELKRDAAIASLSLGAVRPFSFKHKQTTETISQTLDHGSLLMMKGATQTYWLHQLPTTKKVDSPRINLTFRCIKQE